MRGEMHSMGSPSSFTFDPALGGGGRFAIFYGPGHSDLEVYYGDYRAVQVIHPRHGVIARGHLTGWSYSHSLDEIAFEGRLGR